MSLIKSISGIRGILGGNPGDFLTPIDVVKFASAYGTWILQRNGNKKCKVIVGRDARISGPMVNSLVTATLAGLGIDVIDTGLSTTPTVEMAVVMEKADGGIILTASHNPKQWNALKLLNEKGEFISGTDGAKVLDIAENDSQITFAGVDNLGKITLDDSTIQKHIDAILALPLVDLAAIKSKNFSVVIDCVNSSGGIVLPILLEALGVQTVTELFCEPNGLFPHNPEPLPEHLQDISAEVVKQNAHLGIVVDPDVDRLALVCEDGSMFGEEYTLVAVADYVLKNKVGNTVSNLSSTRALRDVTELAGGTYNAAAVGEVNVVEKMKATNAIIGGEGNGGIIYPELHYGRDALVGIALFLSHLAKTGMTTLELRKSYPNYFISKNKIDLKAGIDTDDVLKKMHNKYEHQPVNTIDGVKIEFDKEWVHLRKSNTEPIIRIYAESKDEQTAQQLAQRIISDIKEIVG